MDYRIQNTDPAHSSSNMWKLAGWAEKPIAGFMTIAEIHRFPRDNACFFGFDGFHSA